MEQCRGSRFHRDLIDEEISFRQRLNVIHALGRDVSFISGSCERFEELATMYYRMIEQK